MKKFVAGMLLGLLAFTASAWADVSWEQNYDTALQKAQKEQKLVMVDVYTDWCGWCKKLDKDAYGNKDVAAKLSHDFISVKINPEKTAANAKLAKQFGVNGYPHIAFVDRTGKKVAEIVGYLPAREFLKKLNEVTDQAKKK
jgi:thiol:disulfide interchange protein